MTRVPCASASAKLFFSSTTDASLFQWCITLGAPPRRRHFDKTLLSFALGRQRQLRLAIHHVARECADGTGPSSSKFTIHPLHLPLPARRRLPSPRRLVFCPASRVLAPVGQQAATAVNYLRHCLFDPLLRCLPAPGRPPGHLARPWRLVQRPRLDARRRTGPYPGPIRGFLRRRVQGGCL